MEFWVHPGSDEVTATRVVQLETREAEAWAGWKPSRLLRFMRGRLGVSRPAGAVGDRAD